MDKIQMQMRRQKWKKYADRGELHKMSDVDVLAYPMVLLDADDVPYDESDMSGMPEAQLIAVKRDQLRRLAIPRMGRKPRIAPERRSYTVYLVSDGLGVRIGSTAGQMQTHLKEIQKGNPRKLTVLVEKGGMSWTQANKEKGILRSKVKHKEISQGWFDMTQDEVRAASLLLDKVSVAPDENDGP